MGEVEVMLVVGFQGFVIEDERALVARTSEGCITASKEPAGPTREICLEFRALFARFCLGRFHIAAGGGRGKLVPPFRHFT